jgi:hypothetical protein
MIEKMIYESGFELICDTCSNYEEFEVGNNWEEFIIEAKEKGWRFVTEDNGSWAHYCPVCVEK